MKSTLGTLLEQKCGVCTWQQKHQFCNEQMSSVHKNLCKTFFLQKHSQKMLTTDPKAGNFAQDKARR